MDKKLQTLLVCPKCKGPLQYQASQNRLLCQADQIYFPVRDQIPMLLSSEAKVLEPAG